MWLLDEGRTVSQILTCESKLSGVYGYDGSPFCRRAVTPRQVAVVLNRLALLQERLAAIRAARPTAPISFYEPCCGNDADFLPVPGSEDDDFEPVADRNGLFEAEASGLGEDANLFDWDDAGVFDWDDAAGFDWDENEDFFEGL